MLQPPTPPPMMTARAELGTGGMGSPLMQAFRAEGCLETVSLGGAVQDGQPLIHARVAESGPQTFEIGRCIPAKVKVQRGDAALEHAPHRLAEIRHAFHKLKARDPLSSGRAEIALQQQFILRVVKTMLGG